MLSELKQSILILLCCSRFSWYSIVLGIFSLTQLLITSPMFEACKNSGLSWLKFCDRQLDSFFFFFFFLLLLLLFFLLLLLLFFYYLFFFYYYMFFFF